MSSHSPSLDTPNGPRAKRKRQLACDTCVASKTRCQDVEAEGCLLCRRRRRLCSLATVSNLADAHPSPPSVYINGLAGPSDHYHQATVSEQRIAELEARVAQLEAASTGAPTMSRPISTQPTPYAVTSFRENMNDSAPGTYSKEAFFAGAFSGTSAYPDAIARGLYTQTEVEMCFQHFKHVFSTTCLPLSPFSQVTTPAPTHPFVILVILHFLGPHTRNPHDLAGLVTESIVAAMSGEVSLEVVIALLILSFAPPAPLNEDTTAPTPLRLIALAHSIGSGLGLHARTEAVLRDPTVLVERGWEDEMERVQLWAAVCNRLNMLQLLSNTSSSHVPMTASQLPHSPLSHVQACTEHLQAEEALIRRALALVVLLKDLAVDIVIDPADLNPLSQNWLPSMDAVWSLSQPHPFESTASRSRLAQKLECDALCLRFALEMRAAVLAQALPSPLIVIKQELYRCAAPVSKTALRLLEAYEASNYATWERHAFAGIAMATIAIRNFVAVVTKLHPSNPAGVDLDLVARVEHALRATPGPHVRVLDYTLLEWRQPAPEADAGDVMGGFDIANFIDPNYLPWDLALLFPSDPAGAGGANGI